MATEPKPTMRTRPKGWVADNLPKDLRALTIRQPFAWAVVRGFKCVENRRHPPPATLIGPLIAIHAGAACVTDRDIERVGALAGKVPSEFEVGAIIGFARLVNWSLGPRKLTYRERRWYHPNSHAWLLDDVYLLKRPIRCVGQLGFWRVKGNLLREVRKRLR